MRRVVILGGGYAGLHAFNKLRSRLRREISRGEVELVLVSRDGHHIYHGWTGEVLSGDLPVDSTLTPLKPLLGTSFVKGEVVSADLGSRTLTVMGEAGEQIVSYDQLLIAAGSVDPFERIPGLAEHGWCVKNSSDMQKLVARLDVVENTARNVVVVGGGLAGVETASALAARFQRTAPGKVMVHLVSSSDALLPSLRPDFNHIAETARRQLAEQGVQLHEGQRVARIEADHVELDNGEVIVSDLSVVAAGLAFTTLPGTQSFPRNRAGQIIATDDLRVRGSSSVWVAGDIAAVAHPGTGEPCPINALWAMKQGDCVGANMARVIKGRRTRRFNFRGLGQAAGLAGRRGITELFGLQFTGKMAWVIRILFFAWYMPSRRGALHVLSLLGQNVWNAVTHKAVQAPAKVAERPGSLANVSGRLR